METLESSPEEDSLTHEPRKCFIGSDSSRMVQFSLLAALLLIATPLVAAATSETSTPTSAPPTTTSTGTDSSGDGFTIATVPNPTSTSNAVHRQMINGGIAVFAAALAI
ncbi:hypothetical protein V2G26_004582 [Clonostachys chloroleuca]